MAQCQGTNKNGERCKRQVSGDAVYCYAHADAAETSSVETPAAPETTNHRHAGRAVVR